MSQSLYIFWQSPPIPIQTRILSTCTDPETVNKCTDLSSTPTRIKQLNVQYPVNNVRDHKRSRPTAVGDALSWCTVLGPS